MGKEEELGTLGEDGFSWIMLGGISDLEAVKNVGKNYIEVHVSDLGGEDSSEEKALAEVEGCCSLTACCRRWKF